MACDRLEKDIYIPHDIDIYDKLKIYQIIDYRHITKKEVAEINAELENIKAAVDKNYLIKSRFKTAAYFLVVLGLAGVLGYK